MPYTDKITLLLIHAPISECPSDISTMATKSISFEGEVKGADYFLWVWPRLVSNSLPTALYPSCFVECIVYIKIYILILAGFIIVFYVLIYIYVLIIAGYIIMCLSIDMYLCIDNSWLYVFWAWPMYWYHRLRPIDTHLALYTMLYNNSAKK